jgi:hypothetical protein
MFKVGVFPSLVHYNIYTSFTTKIQKVLEILRAAVILRFDFLFRAVYINYI